ncbi:MAG TPA: ribosomal protein L7/L12 [Pyrinomonadaceae bacterium]|jgi:ribosomal protein L7/L12/sugar lactone lactonase YvrE
MTESFRCPSCSAPLEFEGVPVQKCRFCGSSVIVPASVMQSANVFGGAGRLDFGDLSALTGKALKIAEIQRLIQSGQKIYAVKLFRETFGVGLREAKEAVDAMEEGRSIDLSGMRVATSFAPAGFRSNAENIAEIQSLLRGGNKIEAIRRFREMTGVGLKEAKDAVEAIERGENLDISKMQAQSSAARLYIQNDPHAVDTVKKVGVAVGGSILGSVVITFVLIAGAIIGVFYLVSGTIDDAVEKSGPAPIAPRPVPSQTAESSIARELLKFGGEGTGAGKFKDNRAVAVDADGKIYSGDRSGGRIQVFDAGGNFQTQIMTGDDRIIDSLGVDRKGNLYALTGYDVRRFSKETGEDLGKYRVDAASDLAVGLDGKLYVATRRGEITVLSSDGTKLQTIKLGKDLGIDWIAQIALDGAGNFFLLDGRNAAVFKIAPDGRLLTRFGGRGEGSPDKMPKTQFYGGGEDLAVDSQGRLYVSQVSRISVFDANGNYLNDFKATQAFGMTFNDQDELFVAARPFVVKYKVSL